MSNLGKIRIEEYVFTVTDHEQAVGRTAVTVCVSGSGKAKADLSAWMMIIGDAQAGILSCEKRRCGGAWVPAVAEKPTYERTGIQVPGGAFVDEWVGREKDDPAIEFRITFDRALDDTFVRFAYMTGETIYQSTEAIHLGTPENAPKIWHTPIEKSFCIYVVVTDGYKPAGACKTGVSITKRGAYMAYEVQDTGEDMRCIKTQLQGCVKILVTVPLKSAGACGGDAAATACDCFELCETIGYSREDARFSMRDITVCPKKKSFDLTLLNTHCGRSVYRLDGQYIIDCKRCEMPCCKKD